MPLPKSIHAYGHIQQVLDAALPLEKSTFSVESAKAATRWRQEAYYYRRLCQDKGDHRYDSIFIQIKGNVLHIGRRAIAGKLQTPDGRHVAVAPERALGEREEKMQNAAERLATTLGLDVDDD